MRFATALAAATILLNQAAMASAADELPVLNPSSAWNLRYDEDKCRMLRAFGEGEKKVTLVLDQSGPEPYYTLTLIGHRVNQANGKYMRVRFGDEAAMERSFLKGELPDDTPIIAMHGLNLAPASAIAAGLSEAEVEPIGPAREAAIEHIAFSAGLDDPFTLATGSLGEPLAAMRTCTADLAKYLGGVSQVARPKDNPGTWLSSNDYPTAMLNRNEEGTVRFRLTVDGQGKTTSCHITRSTRPQTFDDAVCLALLKRATFEPALDLQGKPVASYWHSSVRFEIPN